ncbi:hypothetical protein C4D60_Mb09t22060 [Musa balbisiana]|uniref:Bifunctional inhibitor/plant lipid transfer protein/seed storage helical domain-containing protein n=1 Tax=Musa balbisiana TaxID=52838 RepID=A0A4S8IKN2_MUSBA|nr:hypothetical protein C4D60_Mb09t22060 [Musa balbisiana]
MARRAFEMTLALLLAAVLCAPSSAQTSGCSPTLASLSPCIGYLVGTSSSPTSTCCTQLADVVQTQTQCLCAILGGGITQLGFVLNQTQAFTLPGACNIKMSPATQCSGFTVSAPAAAPTAVPTPTASPAAAPPTDAPPAAAQTPASVPTDSTPPVSTPPSGSGAKTTTQASMARSSTKSNTALFSFFFLLFVASCA